MSGKRRLESTQYPGIYKRITAEGKLEGYQIKPRFPGYSGPKSFTRERLTDARELLDQIRQDVRKGVSGSEQRRTLAEAATRYRAEELLKLAPSERPNRERQLAGWEARRGFCVLRDVTRTVVRDVLRLLHEEGHGGAGPVKCATANRYKAALSAVLSSCVDWEWLQANPLHTGSRRKRQRVSRRKSETGRFRSKSGSASGPRFRPAAIPGSTPSRSVPSPPAPVKAS
jgi:hypothetical protein